MSKTLQEKSNFIKIDLEYIKFKTIIYKKIRCNKSVRESINRISTMSNIKITIKSKVKFIEESLLKRLYR